LKGPL